MTRYTTHEYHGHVRVPHNLTGDGTDHSEWLRELRTGPRSLRWGRTIFLAASIALWFGLGWAALAILA